MLKRIFKNNYFIAALLIIFVTLSATVGWTVVGDTDAYFSDSDTGAGKGSSGNIGITLSETNIPFSDTAEDVEPILWGSLNDFAFTVKNEGKLSVDLDAKIVAKSSDTIDWENVIEYIDVYDINSVTNNGGVYVLNEDATPVATKTVTEDGIEFALPREVISGSKSWWENKTEWIDSEGNIISNSAYKKLSSAEQAKYTKCEDSKEYELILFFNSAMTETMNLEFYVHVDAAKHNNSVGWSESAEFGPKYTQLIYNPYHNLLEAGPDFNADLMTLAGVPTTSTYSLRSRSAALPELQDTSSYAITTKTIEFTDIAAPADAETIDVSYANDGSLLAWYNSTTEKVYVSAIDGGNLRANEDCSYMFVNWNGPIAFDNFDSDETTDMNHMFYGYNYHWLDLTEVECENVTDMSHMFDSSKSSFLTIADDIDTSKVENMSYMFYKFGGPTSISTSINLPALDTNNVLDMSYMFSETSSVTFTFPTDWDVSNVTNMSHMFDTISSTFKDVDFSTWNVPNVEDMSYMFRKSISFLSFGGEQLTSWDVSNVTDMSYMFADNGRLSSISLAGWNSANVEDMSYMFAGCSGYDGARGEYYGVSSIDLTGFKTDSCENMSYMFKGCYMLESLDLSSFNTEKVKDMSHMFEGCTYIAGTYSAHGSYGIQTIDMSSFDTKNVEDMSYMFAGCSSLDSLDVSGFDTSSCTNMAYMFYDINYNAGTGGSHGPTTIDVSGFNTALVEDMQYMFYNCYRVGTINVSGFDTTNVENMAYMFYKCSAVTALDVSQWNTENVTNTSYMFYYCSALTSLELSSWNTENVTNMSYMFYNCSKMTTIGSNQFDTSKVTNMDNMFYACSSLKILDLTSWNTSLVTNMNGMFRGCSALTTLTLDGSFDVSNLTTGSYMFYGCSSLTALDLSSWDTSNMTDMSYMFYGCNKLTTLKTNSWNTSKVENMSYMFYGCTAFTSLDLTHFDVSKVTDTRYMFSVAAGLKELDLSTWNFTQPVKMDYMFYARSGEAAVQLRTVYADDWTSNISSATNMFTSCTYLVGDKMAYNASYITGDYATPDGYFTTKLVGVPNAMVSGLKFNSILPSTATAVIFTDTVDTSMELTDLSIAEDGSVVGWLNGTTYYVASTNGEKIKAISCNDMFNGKSSLKTIDLSNLDTSSVSNMELMFMGCTNLLSVNTDCLDTSSLISAYQMFYSCKNLVTLDLTSWDISKLSSAQYMFYSCSGLITIYAGDWTSVITPTTSSYMFRDCSNLVGAIAFDSSKQSWAQANTTTGYFIKRAELTTNMLVDGITFNSILPSTATSVVITDAANMPMETTDLSVLGDGSVVGWLDGTTYYIASTNGEKVIAHPNSAKMFYYKSSLKEVDLMNLDVSKISSAQYMFAYCTALTTIYAENWGDVVTPVGSYYMFYNCSKLIGMLPYASSSVDWTKANTTLGYFTDKNSLTTNMLVNGSTLNSIIPSTATAVVFTDSVSATSTTDLSALKDGSVVGWSSGTTYYIASVNGDKILAHPNSANMFKDKSSKLKTIDFTNLDSSRIVNAQNMFYNCKVLTSVNAELLDTSNVKWFNNMFYYCSALTSLDLGTWNTENATNMYYMFYNCQKLTTLDLSGWNTSKLSNISYMFQSCSALIVLDLSGWDVSAVTTSSYMFNGCSKLAIIYGEDWTSITTPTSSYMFNGCSNLVGAISYNSSKIHWDYANPTTGYFTDKNSLPTNMLLDGYSFNAMVPSTATTVVFTDTVDSAITEVDDLSILGDGSVVGWLSDTTYYVASTNGDKILAYPNSGNMFYNKTSLATIDFTNLDTNMVTNMSYMFYNCKALASVNTELLDTSNVINMAYMFYYCSALQELNVADWDVSKVVSTTYMFYYCSGLTELDLSGWNFTVINNSSYMFRYCTSLVTIYASDWTSAVTPGTSTYMFYNCNKLVGTITYSSSKSNWTYANPTTGYFTVKVDNE